MQRGYIFHTGHALSEGGKGRGAWHVRFYQKDGTQKSQRLGPWLGEPTPPDAIRNRAEEVMAPHQGEHKSEYIPFRDYVDAVYLPVRQQTMRPPSYAADINLWKVIKPHVAVGLLLCQFGPQHAKAILDGIHAEKPRSRTTYRRLRSFLSGVLAYAYSNGIKMLATQVVYGKKGVGTAINLVKCPKGIAAKEKLTYTDAQIAAMLAVLDEPTRTIVHLAAQTGLRKSEIQGLQWEDLDVNAEVLHIRRTVWFGKNATPGGLPYSIGETKTEGSAADVPIDTAMLEALIRIRPENATGWIFQSRKLGGHPRHLSNLVSTAIVPKLEEIGLPWLGWHSFRHSFATRLNDIGIDMKTRQAMLRHKDPHTTQAVYTHANADAMRLASDASASRLVKAKKS